MPAASLRGWYADPDAAAATAGPAETGRRMTVRMPKEANQDPLVIY